MLHSVRLPAVLHVACVAVYGEQQHLAGKSRRYNYGPPPTATESRAALVSVVVGGGPRRGAGVWGPFADFVRASVGLSGLLSVRAGARAPAFIFML